MKKIEQNQSNIVAAQFKPIRSQHGVSNNYAISIVAGMGTGGIMGCPAAFDALFSKVKKVIGGC